MGFAPNLVDKVLKENDKGDENVDLFLENLFAYSEVDVHTEGNGDRRATLLMMKFSVQEVEFAITKLGCLNLYMARAFAQYAKDQQTTKTSASGCSTSCIHANDERSSTTPRDSKP